MKVKCKFCNSLLEDESDHLYWYDCIRTLVKRVEQLENELLAKRLLEDLPRSSEPGFLK